MATPDSISVAQLARLLSTPDAPTILDVRIPDDIARDPRFLPCSRFEPAKKVPGWAASYAGQSTVIVCQRGEKLSQGVAAWLRHEGVRAENLEGGFEAWQKAGLMLASPEHVPPRDEKGRTIWVTRTRPKIDRIACPWLIRRFIDPKAVFLFVSPSEVAMVADRFGATPFDIEGVFWSHRDTLCTFDIMIAEFGLCSDALDRLAGIVRAADTANLDAAPEAAGLLAASLGYSRMYRDDLAQLDAAMGLYDAFYRWARDATNETHNWQAPQGHRL